jgi:hypothetical protein
MNDTELDEMLNFVVAPMVPTSLRGGLVAALPAPRRKLFGMPLRWVLVGGATALCAVLGAAALNVSPAQVAFYGSVQSADGPLYETVTRIIDPPSLRLGWKFPGGAFSFGGTLAEMRGYRDMHNRFTNAYVGYQYKLDQVSDGNYLVTFSPVDAATIQKNMGPFKFMGQILQQPPLPDPSIVHLDEPFQVTLYSSGGERIYDRIVVSRTAPQRTPVGQPDPATTLRLAGPQVYVNGELALTKADAGSGPVVWVHLSGHGRFLAALDSQNNPRFVRAGNVNGNVMEFESEGIQFRIVCSGAITSGGDRPIFVYHQQSFEGLLDQANPLSQKPMLGSAGPASLQVQ